MRLTVGSLPAAVYWRRRAIVLGAILIVLLLGWASCSGPDSPEKSNSAAGNGKRPPSQPPISLFTPPAQGTSAQPQGAGTPPAPPSAVPAGADTADSAGPDRCADDELLLTPLPAEPSVATGEETRLVLKVKNISTRTCPRDLGADEQELYLMRDATKIWSSDVCQPLKGSSVRTLAPNDEQAFTVVWDGLATADGCNGRKPPSAGQYQLLARLGTKLSAPVVVTLTGE